MHKDLNYARFWNWLYSLVAAGLAGFHIHWVSIVTNPPKIAFVIAVFLVFTAIMAAVKGSIEKTT